MREQIKSLKKDLKRKLSIADIRREGYMPWAKHHRTIIGIIRADMTGPNILKAKVEGENKQLRYTIVSKNLINYLTTYGPALATLARKTK